MLSHPHALQVESLAFEDRAPDHGFTPSARLMPRWAENEMLVKSLLDFVD